MMGKIEESTRVAPDEDSHVFAMHPYTWHRLASDRVVGTFRNIPIICSENAPRDQVHLMGYDDLKANLRRGLKL